MKFWHKITQVVEAWRDRRRAELLCNQCFSFCNRRCDPSCKYGESFTPTTSVGSTEESWSGTPSTCCAENPKGFIYLACLVAAAACATAMGGHESQCGFTSINAGLRRANKGPHETHICLWKTSQTDWDENTWGISGSCTSKPGSGYTKRTINMVEPDRWGDKILNMKKRF